MNSKEMIGCPKCGMFNEAEFWDKHTKEEEGIPEAEAYVSASEPEEKQVEQEAFHRCPMCNEEIQGVDLIRRKIEKVKNRNRKEEE